MTVQAALVFKAQFSADEECSYKEQEHGDPTDRFAIGRQRHHFPSVQTEIRCRCSCTLTQPANRGKTQYRVTRPDCQVMVTGLKMISARYFESVTSLLQKSATGWGLKSHHMWH